MIIRLEEEKDWREVENLTREAFWNKYRPGCCEHYVLHRYRHNPDFVKELDYVIEEKGRIIAHIMYSRAAIKNTDGKDIPVMTFGPVSVLPELQGRGYGGRLISFSMSGAADLGCPLIAILGDPDYYSRFGFVSGNSVKVYYAGAPRGEEFPYFLVKELRSGFLNEIKGGVYSDPSGYSVDQDALKEFDRCFPPKEMKKLPGQLG